MSIKEQLAPVSNKAFIFLFSNITLSTAENSSAKLQASLSSSDSH